MKSSSMNRKENYLSPDTEIIYLSIETSMLNLSGPTPSGETIVDDGELPWPGSNTNYNG